MNKSDLPTSGYDPIVGLPGDPVVALDQKETDYIFNVSAVQGAGVAANTSGKLEPTAAFEVEITSVQQSGPGSNGTLPFTVPSTSSKTSVSNTQQLEFSFSYNSGYNGSPSPWMEVTLSFDGGLGPSQKVKFVR